MVNNARFKEDMSCSMVDNARPERFLSYCLVNNARPKIYLSCSLWLIIQILRVTYCTLGCICCLVCGLFANF